MSRSKTQKQVIGRHKNWMAVVALLFGTTHVVLARPQVSVYLSGTSDDNEGRTLDGDVSVSNASWWQLGAGGGSTLSFSSAGELRGTNKRVFADAHSDRLDARAYYQYWQAAPYALRTTGARTSFSVGDWQINVVGEAKNLKIDYLADPTTGQRDTAHFSGSGWGGGVNYRHRQWGVYVSGTWYRYGALSRYLQTQFFYGPPSGNSGGVPGSTAPLLPGEENLPPPNVAPPPAPSAPGLIGSLLAFNQGVLSRQLATGVTHDFKQSSIYVDWSVSKDVVYAGTVNYYSTSYLYQFTASVRAVATVGMSRSDYGPSSYGGLSLGFDF